MMHKTVPFIVHQISLGNSSLSSITQHYISSPDVHHCCRFDRSLPWYVVCNTYGVSEHLPQTLYEFVRISHWKLVQIAVYSWHLFGHSLRIALRIANRLIMAP